MTKSSGVSVETRADPELFRIAVAQERRLRLRRRRFACLIAWALIAFGATTVLALLVGALFSKSALGSVIFGALVILAEPMFIGLGHALSDDFEWPRPRRIYVEVDVVDTGDIPEADDEWFKRAKLRVAS